MSTSVKSPGGWAALLNARITRWLVVGALAVSGGGGAVAVYGQFQGAEASHVIEAELSSATKDTVTYSALNPLPNNESGAIMYGYDSFIFVAESASPATRLNVCTAAAADTACPGTTASNVMSGVILEGTNRQLTLVQTGAVTAQAPVILAPRDYASPAKKYLNFTFVRGSGQTLSGNPPAFVHIEVKPCHLTSTGC